MPSTIAGRNGAARIRALAISLYADENTAFDDGCRVNMTDGGGAWVQAWLYIGPDEIEEYEA